MADLSSSASRRQLSVTTPSQISKGGQGSENLIPLSPQWLLPKPGESKTGMLTGEKPPSPNPSFCSRLDTMKSSGNGDEIRDTQKKDVFRPSLMDMEAGGHRERWRDEERDTNSSGRKDRWRDGDKEIGDTRKMDRWMENSSAKQFGEARRAPLERWTDSSNKESNYEQRRENKWNMRWGPNDKEAEGFQIRDTQKMDVFSPSLMDMEAGGRRERWRDEERDTNSSGRKDRWRDGDKEIGDTRRMDRWMENSSAKQFGEARRAPLERWTDSSNKESNYEQRRENKWNTRWGPNDKEAEG